MERRRQVDTVGVCFSSYGSCRSYRPLQIHTKKDPDAHQVMYAFCWVLSVGIRPPLVMHQLSDLGGDFSIAHFAHEHCERF
jgi:hypothetical protein